MSAEAINILGNFLRREREKEARKDKERKMSRRVVGDESQKQIFEESQRTDEERFNALKEAIGGDEGVQDVERLRERRYKGSSAADAKPAAAKKPKSSAPSTAAAGASSTGGASGQPAKLQRTLHQTAASTSLDWESILSKAAANNEPKPDDDVGIDVYRKMLDREDRDLEEQNDPGIVTNFFAGLYGGDHTTAASQVAQQQALSQPSSAALSKPSAATEAGLPPVVVVKDELSDFKEEKAKQKPQASQRGTAARTAGTTEGVNYVQQQLSQGSTIFIETGQDLDEQDQPLTAPQVAPGGSDHFYWIDAKENTNRYYSSSAAPPGCVFLFGRKWNTAEGKFRSCCVRVDNIQRCVMILPRSGSSFSDAVAEVNETCKAARIDVRRLKKVTRYYAFEREGVPKDSAEWLKLRYPASLPQFPGNNNFTHIDAVFGAQRSPLELFIIKRRLKGPSYLRIENLEAATERFSHCYEDFVVSSPKNVFVESGGIPPLLTSLSIQLVTQLDEHGSHNELMAASLISCNSVAVDGGGSREIPHTIRFVGVRSFNKTTPLPLDLDKVCSSNKLSNVRRFQGEAQLLDWIAETILAVDPDIIVGHNFLAYTLDVLLHRFVEKKISSWSALGRLIQLQMPKLQSGAGGLSEATFQEREVLAGRLVADTYLLAREYYKSTNYKLSSLAGQMGLNGLLGCKQQEETGKQNEITATVMTDANSIFALLARSLHESLLSFELLYRLDAVPLTKRLCSVAGNLWSRTLTGSRSERIEYLLLHSFHELKFVTPDRKTFDSKSKRREEEGAEDDKGAAAGAKTKYKGGMVLDPKSGLYTDYVLLLDFNSLYPSLIQEFNICFTTVKRGKDDVLDVPPPEALVCLKCAQAGAPSPCPHRCVLPRVIKGLVDSRREVKKLMKSERDPNQLAQLEIRQKALKLTANSMYGCLGFEFSRFFAQPLAELVTRQGRTALQTTVDLVPTINPSLRVIYGDTDSVMIQTGVKDDLKLVRNLGLEIKAKVNKKYQSLEIDIDGVFRSILLMTKKKYAALSVVDWATDGLQIKKEIKGLDMVRRDWCALAKQASDEILSKILASDGDDVVQFIIDFMKQFADDIRSGKKHKIDDFVISKSLTKEPESYKGGSFPHATVALRMKERNEAARVGDLIPYVICEEGDAAGDAGIDGSSKHHLSNRAFHVDELRKTPRRLDIEWYLSTQVYPPVLRICTHVQSFLPSMLSEAMGIAVSHPAEATNNGGAQQQFQSADGEDYASHFKSLDLEECFPTADPLQVTCENCKVVVPIKPHKVIREVVEVAAKAGKALTPFSPYPCQACQRPHTIRVVANSLRIMIHRLVREYYRNGGTNSELVKLRSQMTYLRHQFDFPQNPGCPPALQLAHREFALKYLDEKKNPTTHAVFSANESVVFDPVKEAAIDGYNKMLHMKVSLAQLFQGLSK